METSECIKTRRSIRKYSDKPVSKELTEEIVKEASYSPTWKNTQTVRYYATTDKAKLQNIACECFGNFEHNKNIVSGAGALIVLTTVEGIAGFEADGSYTTSKGTHWQSFDAGIAAQTFCLSAFDKGIGTVIMGIYDETKIKAAFNIPEEQSVSALIAAGYFDELPGCPKHKDLHEILKFS